VGQEEVAGFEGFGLEVGTVGGEEEPMFDGSAEELDGANGGEFSAEDFGVAGFVEVFGEDQPDAVVFGLFQAFSEHEDDLVADVDGVAAEHGADFGIERGEGFEDEGVRDGFAFGGFGGAGHGGRITLFWVVEGLESS